MQIQPTIHSKLSRNSASIQRNTRALTKNRPKSLTAGQNRGYDYLVSLPLRPLPSSTQGTLTVNTTLHYHDRLLRSQARHDRSHPAHLHHVNGNHISSHERFILARQLKRMLQRRARFNLLPLNRLKTLHVTMNNNQLTALLNLFIRRTGCLIIKRFFNLLTYSLHVHGDNRHRARNYNHRSIAKLSHDIWIQLRHFLRDRKVGPIV